MRIIKNKQDKRFLDTEQKINQTFIAFLHRGDRRIYVQDLCDEAQIFSSTFYDHYPNMYVVLETIEHNLQRDFLKYITEAGSLDIILRRLLIFICKNRDYFLMANQKNNYAWFVSVFCILKPKLIGHWRPRAQGTMERWFQMLCGELIATLNTWCQQSKFDAQDITVVQNRLQKLISTAEIRFRQLDNMK